MSTSHDATFYVQIERKRKYRNGKSVTASAVRLTQEKPAVTGKNTVNVKLTVRLADSAFDPVEPAVMIEVPDSLIQKPTYVIVEDAGA